MIIDHVGMTVTDYERSKKFYTLILAPLNIKPLTQHEDWIGFGKIDNLDEISRRLLNYSFS